MRLKFHVLTYVLVILVSLFMLLYIDSTIPVAYAEGQALVTVTYTPISAGTILANPERGVLRQLESWSSAKNPRWSPADFTEPITEVNTVKPENLKLFLCVFYLDKFLSSDITSGFLNDIVYNLDQVRVAGRKCIVRFAYTNGSTGTTGDCGPLVGDTEPSMVQIKAHIDQLKLILSQNSDVIALVQAGFIGRWGEWCYTNNFAGTHYNDRYEVLKKLLDAVPTNRMVAVRLIRYKQEMKNLPALFSSGQLARIGFHNDAFLNAWGDEGTFGVDENDIRLATDVQYLQQETKSVVMGGETNDPPDPPEPSFPGRSCTTARNDLALFHWSYLKADYYTPTLQTWEKDGCLAEFQNNLGYRFVLQRGIYPSTARPGGPLPVRIELLNKGYAAPFNSRSVVFALYNATTNTLYRFNMLGANPRLWLPGSTQTLSYTFTLPINLPTGKYTLMLHMPDADSRLSNRWEYAIRLANANVLRDGSGYNNLLYTVAVSTNASTAALESSDPTPPDEALAFPFDDTLIIDVVDPTSGATQLYLPVISQQQ